ncbi:ATP-binding cassette domain-containing protein [Paenibacillus piscarius]|uniref:ATP-binding cassette domain-containing protein n=1 Tax=Paenibacillus piscarius TaxID=1089681 RepID=UPI001EE7DA36|nr:ATP-binding cassette domain-containing protein [Paenibacillus piscarius]
MGYALTDISVRLDGRDILHSASCHLQEGKWISLIGRTGAGKSTLAKVVKGLVPFYSGEYRQNGQPMPRDRKGRLKAVPQIGYVFQYPEQQLFAATVEQELGFALTMLGASRTSVDQAIQAVMEKVGIPAELLPQNPFQLSGGLKRRVAIASVLIADPELLILDEPAAGLDPASRRKLLSRLRSWQKENGRTVLFISHQLEDVAEYSDEVILLNEGNILGHYEVNELFLKHPEQAGLPLPEPVQLLRLVERLSGQSLEPASCREADIMERVRAVWHGKGKLA